MTGRSERHAPKATSSGWSQSPEQVALSRITDSVLAFDVGWLVTYANPQGAALFGRLPEALSGKHFWTEFPDLLGSPLHRALRLAMETQEPGRVIAFSPLDAADYEVRLFPSPDGLTAIATCLGRRGEPRGVESGAPAPHPARSLLAKLPLPVVLLDPVGGGVRFANDAAQFALGELATDGGSEGAFFVAEGGGPLPRSEWPRARVLRGEVLDGVPFELHSERGRSVYLCSSSIIDAPEGQTAALALIFQDVTPLKDLEEALERAVREHDDFLSVASHELRTPLTSANLQLQTAQSALRKAGIAKGSEVEARLSGLQRSLGRLSRLIEGLLDVSIARGARIEVEPEDVDGTWLVGEVLSRMIDEFESYQCLVRADLQPGVTGRWDRLRLEQVVTNLLTNALKYGRGAPIDVTLEADAEHARVSIRDHGIGIHPDDQVRIFQAFERAVSPRHYGGLGLGLWIVRQIVVAMGGTIRLESMPGEGACFTVELPRVPPPKLD